MLEVIRVRADSQDFEQQATLRLQGVSVLACSHNATNQQRYVEPRCVTTVEVVDAVFVVERDGNNDP